MFTGLISCDGLAVSLVTTAAGIRLRVATELAGALGLGDSVAVNGVCLTVTALDGDQMHADIGPETARVTTLGAMHGGRRVNLERSMRADSRFGGHFVQGHVDGTGTVMAIRPDGDAHWLSIGFPPALAPYLVAKGSVAVDGISLTVAALGEDRFDVMIIPFTWEHTNIASLHEGTLVNLECDMVGKYVARGVELAVARAAALQQKR
jgi:riboflavin synthase